MADGHEGERATFQFIDKVQICPDLSDVSSAGYNNTKEKQEEALGRACCTLHREPSDILLIYVFIQTLIIFQCFLFLLWRLTYNRIRHKRQLFVSATALHFGNLASVVI